MEIHIPKLSGGTTLRDSRSIRARAAITPTQHVRYAAAVVVFHSKRVVRACSATCKEHLFFVGEVLLSTRHLFGLP